MLCYVVALYVDCELLNTHENFVWSRNLNCPEKLMKHFFFKILRRFHWYKSLFIICLDLWMRTVLILRSKWCLKTRYMKSKYIKTSHQKRFGRFATFLILKDFFSAVYKFANYTNLCVRQCSFLLCIGLNIIILSFPIETRNLY